jgi:UDP-N-acetylglucosamine:LPS N-acetylglucosamine transferase
MTNKVVITSVDAGGGHVAVMDSLFKTLSGQEDKHIEVEKYYSKQSKYDNIYRLIARSPLLLEFLHFSSIQLVKWFKPLITWPELGGAKALLKESKPQIILSTHPFQSLVFQTLKEKMGLSQDIVTVICDYGDPREYIQYAPKVDYFIVRDEETRQKALKYLPPEKADSVFIFGTVVNEVFEKYHAMPQAQVESEFKAFLAEESGEKVQEFDDARPTLLVVGGSGWVRKSNRLIQKLAESGKYNLLVCCGKDEGLRNKFCPMPGVFCFGFLEQEKLALIEAKADVAVLSTLAPATMYELLTINRYPLFVHRYHARQEAPHIKLLKDWKIGIYEPDDTAMMQQIDEYLANPSVYREYVENGAIHCTEEKRKAAANYQFIQKIVSKRPVIDLEAARDEHKKAKSPVNYPDLKRMG